MQREGGEAHVQATFLDAVGSVPGCFVLRINVLTTRMPSGAWVRSAPDGTPDVLLTLQGQSCAVECKRPKGGRVSEAQTRWRTAFVAAGGVWMRCNNATETVAQLAGLASGETKAALVDALARLKEDSQLQGDCHE